MPLLKAKLMAAIEGLHANAIGTSSNGKGIGSQPETFIV